MFGRALSVKIILEHTFKTYFTTTVRYASVTAVSAKRSNDQRYMIVDFNKNGSASNNDQLKYPLIWLRDNCQCSSCFDAQTKSRIIDWAKFNFKNAQPKSISVSFIFESVFFL